VRTAILDGRLKRGTRLPATRDLALQYSISRGTAVSVFEQLQAEGYIKSRVGSGTRVNDLLPEDLLQTRHLSGPAQHAAAASNGEIRPARPFRANEPALDLFPTDVWARIASRRLRRASPRLLAGGSAHGYRPLREAIAAYLGSARGVECSPDQVVVVSGVQQGLDLAARLLLKAGDRVWMEDPGYSGAVTALCNAGAHIVPVPVDDHGLDVAAGRRLAPGARAAYTTPAHQFPLGMTMPVERRLTLLKWAREARAYIIEDDYDSEYRFAGRPIPALQGLDGNGSVIFLGSFNKVMFPGLRLGYVVLPAALVEALAAFRFHVDRYPPALDQAILCDFIVEGHLGRHIRRMRELYSSRLDALLEAARQHLAGRLEIPPIEAGLHTAAMLPGRIDARRVEQAAAAREVETIALDRFAIRRKDIRGLLLGFAAFDARQIRSGVAQLAAALEKLC
jgi:GntR family transcriptional regulator/MocR family aminotransferase